MNTLQEFFKKFGLPVESATEDGDILLNEDDSGAHPDLGEGDEVFVSSDNITIDANTLTIRSVCSPGNFKEFFTIHLVVGDTAGNSRLMKLALEDAEDHASGAWTYDL